MPTALLVIDVQKAFYDPPEGPPIDAAEAVLAAQTGLVARARAAGVPVIFVQHSEPGSEFDPDGPGFPLHPSLAARTDEPRVVKTTTDSFHETDLARRLGDLGIDRLVIAGNQTDHCINATTRAAAARGFDVTLASDAHGTWPSGGATAARIVADHNRDLAAVATVRLAAEIGF